MKCNSLHDESRVDSNSGNFYQKIKYKKIWNNTMFDILAMIRVHYLLVFSLVFLQPLAVHSQVMVPVKNTSGVCIDDLSYQLYLLINDYRNSHDLPGIPLSGSLCYVAQVHAKDLVFNRMKNKECGLHSWSDRGRWSPCCFSSRDPDYLCMWNKPKELTSYRFRGHEIIYWQNDRMEPMDALTQWKNQPQSDDMVLNRNMWSKKMWKAVGIAVYEGYAIVWLGEEPDMKGEPELCNEQAVSQPDSSARKTITGDEPSYLSDVRYYLIVASLSTMEKANLVLLEYQQKGFSSARIVTFDNKIRISLNDFDTYARAKKVKTDLGTEYQHVWILER